jgi:hypothetical protein
MKRNIAEEKTGFENEDCNEMLPFDGILRRSHRVWCKTEREVINTFRRERER